MQVTFREIKKAFDIDEKTLYQWLNTAGMPAVKANDQYYFNSVEVLEWALKNHIPLTPGVLQLCENKRHGQDVVTPALRQGGVYYNVQGNSQREILGKVLDLIPLPDNVQRDFLKELLLSREQMGTTGIGEGIAIPHVKHPVALAGMSPKIGLFFLENPVDFSAPDGQKVHTVFVILSSSVKGHLTLLSRLAFCLQDPGVISMLSARSKKEDIEAVFQVAESKIDPLIGNSE